MNIISLTDTAKSAIEGISTQLQTCLDYQLRNEALNQSISHIKGRFDLALINGFVTENEFNALHSDYIVLKQNIQSEIQSARANVEVRFTDLGYQN